MMLLEIRHPDDPVVGKIQIHIVAEYEVSAMQLTFTGSKTIFEHAEREAQNIREGGDILDFASIVQADITTEFLQVTEAAGIPYLNQPKHSTKLDPSVFGILMPFPEIPGE